MSEDNHTAVADAPRSRARPSAARRDTRPWIYAVIDVLMALLYGYVFFFLIPNRHGWVQALALLVVFAPVVMAVSMLLRSSWTWWSAVAGCGALLLLTLTFLVLTIMSAAFLAGVYGSLGQAASAVALIGAALVVEFMGILPALQLKFLMTRAGRRCFGKEPLWP